jgi:CheY-like chemotaxis protein
MRILLVDDDPDTVEAVCQMLQLEGAEVLFVASAAAALSEVERLQPHVLISDMSMPDVDGCDLILNIRAAEKNRRLLAVVLSAHAGAAHRKRAQQAGFDDYLTKPIDPSVLVKALMSLTGWDSGRPTGD